MLEPRTSAAVLPMTAISSKTNNVSNSQDNETVLKIDTTCLHVLVNVASLLQSFARCSGLCRSLASSQVYQAQPTHLLAARLQKEEGRTEQGWTPITFTLLLIDLLSVQANGNYQTKFELIFYLVLWCDSFLESR